MRYLIAGLAILAAASNAFSQTYKKGDQSIVAFGCSSEASIVGLITADNEADYKAVLDKGDCYRFYPPVLVQVLEFRGTAHEPIKGVDVEIYKVETVYGNTIYSTKRARGQGV